MKIAYPVKDLKVDHHLTQVRRFILAATLAA
jgi:hypothetical protein